MKKYILPILILILSAVAVSLAFQQFVKEDFILLALTSVSGLLLFILSIMLFRTAKEDTSISEDTQFNETITHESSVVEVNPIDEVYTEEVEEVEVSSNTFQDLPIDSDTTSELTSESIITRDEILIESPNQIHESLSNIKARLKPKRDQYLLTSLFINLIYLMIVVYFLSNHLDFKQANLLNQLKELSLSNLLPFHVLTILVASITNYLAWYNNSRIMAIVTLALYIVSLMLLPLNFWGVIVQLILCYLGYNKLSS